MSELKKIGKIFGMVFIMFGWLLYEFGLYERDDDVKKEIVEEEVGKGYEFGVVWWKEYRGLCFVGVDGDGDRMDENVCVVG